MKRTNIVKEGLSSFINNNTGSYLKFKYNKINRFYDYQQRNEYVSGTME